MLNRREIYLGFVKGLDKTTVASVQRHYLPLGKVGGRPAWLNPANLPLKKQVECQNCNFPMPFLLQIYCPGTEQYSFHRYLYVFICSNPDCYKGALKQTVKVFRCQLPLKNDYTPDKKIDFADIGEVPDPCFDAEKFKKLCAVCGCYAAKYCSKCKDAYYCSVEHQKLDWKRHDCNPKKILPVEDEIDPFKLTKENEFLFCEHAIEMDCDYAALPDADESDVSSDEDDKEMKRAKEMLDELRKEKGNVVDALPEMYENDDADYDRFKKVIDRDPKQILRYDRHGTPLSATDHVSFPEQIPNCIICKGPRTFEFQLMPYVLSIIENRGLVSPIDFATVCIYTCSKDCKIENDGYAEEYAFKQDFQFTDHGRLSHDFEDEEENH